MAEGFSIVRGGPSHRLADRLGLPLTVRRVIGFSLVTWLPLLMLSAGDSLRTGSDAVVAFLVDFGPHVRFLIALPLLVLAEAVSERELPPLAMHFARSGLVDEAEMPRFRAAIERVRRLRDSNLPEALLLGAALFASIAFAGPHVLRDVAAWGTRGEAPGAAITPAGWWYLVVSTPVNFFLYLKWLWRYCIWSTFLWRVSRLRLCLAASHPDRCGGLAFVGCTQLTPCLILLAASSGLAVAGAQQVLYKGMEFASLTPMIAALVVVGPAIFLLPLLVFTPRLHLLKHQGMLQYGTVADVYAHLFHEKWVAGNPVPEEQVLGSADIQSLADLGTALDNAYQMKVVPITMATVLSLVAAAAIPMLPLALIEFPLREVLRALIGIVL